MMAGGFDIEAELLDFTPSSLQLVERGINQVFPEGYEMEFNNFYVPLGLYLGEVIVGSHPEVAEWGNISDSFSVSTDDLFNISLYVNGMDGTVYNLRPFYRLHMFLNYRKYGLKAFYESVMDMAQGDIDPSKNTDENGERARSVIT